MEIRKQNNQPGPTPAQSQPDRRWTTTTTTTTTTTKMLRFLTWIVLLSVATSDGASVGVVRLDGEAAPQLDQHSDIDHSESLSFLSQYGYLPKSEAGKSFLLSPSGLSSALKQMQKFGGLEESGVLDEATLKLLKTPRCGVPDLIDGRPNPEDEEALDSLTIVDVEEEEDEGYYPSKRRKRYALQGSRWKKRLLTYKVGKYPSKLSRAEVDADVGKAFNMWAKASGLTFSRKYSGSVDIEIRFENYYHGDEDSFDGPGGREIIIIQISTQLTTHCVIAGVVAHAFFPEFGGDAHFDNGEDWTVNKYSVSVYRGCVVVVMLLLLFLLFLLLLLS